MEIATTPTTPWRAVALASAVFGAGVSIYLLFEYTTGQAGVCLTGTGCDEVRASDFAYPLGIPMPLFGVVFYVVAGWLAGQAGPGAILVGVPARTLLVLLGLVGVAASAVLTGLEAFVIGAFCTWCLASAAASVVLLIAALGSWREAAPDPAGGRSGKARQQLRRQADGERRAVRRTFLGSLAVTGVLFGTLLVAGALAGGEPGPSGNVDGLAPASRPHLGTGSVTVVEFADFQCPACAVVAPMLAQLAEEGGVTLVARHFPLESIHANANGSARAAEAAMLQDEYWAMSEALYVTQAAWSDLGSTDADAFFAGLAVQIGLDVDRWTADYASSAVAEGVDGDLRVAQDLGLPQTPTIFIDGEVYDGGLSLDELRAAVAVASATGGVGA